MGTESAPQAGSFKGGPLDGLARRVRLIDNATLRSQLTSLERRVSAADRETVSHPQSASAHDDCATAVCGLLSMSGRPGYDYLYRGFSDAPTQQQQVPAANQGASAAYYKALERESWERYCRAQREKEAGSRGDHKGRLHRSGLTLK